MQFKLSTGPAKLLYFSFALALAAGLALTPADAFAAKKKRAARSSAPLSLTIPAKDAALIVDGVTGNVLYARNANVRRYPASLTKMMTLYLLFEALQQGKVSLASPITASRYAAAQEPTKLGFAAGESISVEMAIKALVVRSANDVAVAVAETLGGTESGFAEDMTRKAQTLGMHNTRFRNASGLPDTLQYTTASDMVRLARHLAYDFPQYYPYFATRTFSYKGRLYETHDNLLDEFNGTDGIKTGYTRISGFNLVSSVVRENRHVVGIVMGGRTARMRDTEMMRLLAVAFDRADDNPLLLASANVPWQNNGGAKTRPLWGQPAMMLAAADPAPQNAVRELLETAALANSAPAKARPALAIPVPKPSLRPQIAEAKIGQLKGTAETNAIQVAFADEDAAESRNVGVDGISSVPAQKFALAQPKASSGRLAAPIEQGDIGGPSLPDPATRDVADIVMKRWAVQIGAFGDAPTAQAQLAKYAERTMDILGQSKRMVTPFSSAEGRKLYRARFGLYSENEAREICKRLTKRGDTCFVTKQAG